MKKFAISLISSIFMMPALAHHGYPHYSEPNHAINRYPYNHRHNRDWVAPAVVVTGVIIASEIARQNREEQILREHDRINRIPQRPIIIERPVIVERRNETTCTAWREIVDSDGRVYKERICTTN